MTWRGRHIYLTGISGSGKTTIGRALASILSKSGYGFLDLDEELEKRAGKSIATIFREPNGETTFRNLETAVLAEIADLSFAQQPYVVATGGGTPISALNQEIMRGSGLVVWVDVTLRQAAKNVIGSMLQGNVRPLLSANSSDEVTQKLRNLLAERTLFYEKASLHFVAKSQRENDRTPQELAEELLNALEQMSKSVRMRPRFETLIAHSALGNYSISIGSGITSTELLRSAIDIGAKRVVIVTDENVAGLHCKKIIQNINRESKGNVDIHQIVISHGEQSKNSDTLFEVLNAFSRLDLSRRDDVVVSIGGGVVSDLTGFATSIFKRGVPVIHIPTTLIGQLDASIGGKTGIDYQNKKNSLGSFYSPKRVIIDPIFLQTLPKRELHSGLSELLKYGLIGNVILWNSLSKSIRRLIRGLDPGYEILIRDGVKEKLRYVTEDEFERANGKRELLNFGHTFGHAFESATGFTLLLHGEAVVLGMRAAAWLSMKEGLLSEESWSSIEVVLGRLPIPSFECDVNAVFTAMLSDKKNSYGNVRLILLEEIGKATVKENIKHQSIKDAIQFVLSIV